MRTGQRLMLFLRVEEFRRLILLGGVPSTHKSANEEVFRDAHVKPCGRVKTCWRLRLLLAPLDPAAHRRFAATELLTAARGFQGCYQMDTVNWLWLSRTR